MFIYIFGAALLGIFIGVGIERYRWVKLAKTNKLKEVEGHLYKVIKVRPRLKTDGVTK